MRLYLFLFAFFSCFFIFADKIQLKVVPFTDGKASIYALPRTVDADRTLVYSKSFNTLPDLDGDQSVTIRFKGLSVEGWSYFYYCDFYYGGPSNYGSSVYFLSADNSNGSGSVNKSVWSTTGYNYDYSPHDVKLYFPKGIGVLLVWEVRLPANMSPSPYVPPNNGADGLYGSVTIPDATSSNPYPVPVLSNPPDGFDGGNTGGGDTGGGDTGGGDTGGGDTGGGGTGGGVTITGNTNVTGTGTIEDGQININLQQDITLDVPPPIEVPEAPSAADLQVDNPIKKISDKLRPNINLPSGGTFHYPSFTIPLPGRDGITISLGDGLSNSTISRSVRLIQGLCNAIGYFLITLVTFKAILKLFRKNS